MFTSYSSLKAERYSVNNNRKTYYANPNFDKKYYDEIEKEYRKPTTIPNEQASNHTAGEQDILCDEIPSIDDNPCEDLHITVPEDWPETQDGLIES